MQKHDRRQFLCFVAGAGGALGVAAAEHAALAADGAPALHSFKRTARALGTDVAITALHADEQTARRAVDAAFDELETVESLMSIYRPDSQLSRLNRLGRLDDAHPYLLDVLRQSRRMSQRSGGAFDVTVQPLWKLFREAQQAGQPPADEEIIAARQRVDWRRVVIEKNCVQLQGDGAEITLNGIAQGYAADRAMEALRGHGVAQALVDTGELGALGGKTDRQPWTVGIQHPRRADAYISLAELSGRCLATSGDYATTFGPGYANHHLFNPATGRSADQLASVSVVADSAAQADALSTAVFVLGAGRGLELIRSTPGADALLVEKTGAVLVTPGFPRST